MLTALTTTCNICCCCGVWLQAAVEAERAAFAALPWDEAVQDVLSGLTAEGMTEEQLATPAQEPEEWQPEVRSVQG